MRGGEAGEGGVSTGGTTITYGSPGVATSRTMDFGAASAASGVSISWSERKVAVGGIAQLSYIRVWQQDAAGNWVSKWEGSNAQANGSGIVDVSQQEAGWSDTVTEYNAFGEMVRRGVNGGRQEYFQYDNAGNLVRTNAKDGKDRSRSTTCRAGHRQHDQRRRGRRQCRPRGHRLHPAGVGHGQPAARGHGLQPAWQRAQDHGARAHGVRGAGSRSIATTPTPPSPRPPRSITFPNPAAVRMAARAAKAARIPTIPVRRAARHQYRAARLDQPGRPGRRRRARRHDLPERRRHAPDPHAELPGRRGADWRDVQLGRRRHEYDRRGVTRVVAMTVYKKDTSGTWQTVINQQGTFGNTGNFIDIAAPVDPGVKVRLEIRVPNGGWSEVGLVNYGNTLRYDAEGLAVATTSTGSRRSPAMA